MYDLIILGAGPAGLAAAIYGKRAGLDLLVIDRSPLSGGQVLNTYEVDNYPGLPGVSGSELAESFRAHADRLGVSFKTAKVKQILKEDDVFKVICARATFESRSLIYAAGAVHAKLDVPGEDAFAGMGVSYCALCDGAFYKDKVTAVVGGGDAALEDAIYLAGICKKVYLIHRREELRGTKVLQEQLMGFDNVEVLYSHRVEEIKGSNAAESLRITHIPTGEEKELTVDGLFIAVGIRPDSGLLQELVQLDEAGYIVAGEDCDTGTAGLFAAGDVRKKPLRQIVTAVADGANAATGAERFLREK